MLPKINATIFLSFLCLISFGQNQMHIDDVFVTTSGGFIVLHETELDNSGTVRDSFATWVFTGDLDTLDSEMGGDSLTVINNLIIDKRNGDGVEQLTGDFKVLGTIYLDSGQINLNQNNIELGDLGWIYCETQFNRITGVTGGVIFKDTILNAPTTRNAGNMGMEITTTSNMGATRIERGHVRQYRWDGLGYGIFRYFDVIPTNNAALNATVKFYYNAAEIPPFTHRELDMWFRNDTLWYEEGLPSGSAYQDSTGKPWMVTSGKDTFSRVTLGSYQRNQLPVSWLSIQAEWKDYGNSSNVFWSTAEEVNSSHFMVQRSYDGYRFEDFMRVESSENPNQINEYKILDDGIVTSRIDGGVFYRIYQEDNDGEYSLSDIVYIDYSEGSNPYVLLYPNPAKDEAFIKTFDLGRDYTVTVTGINGKVVEVFENQNDLTRVKTSHYRKGTYFITIDSKDKNFTKSYKLIKS